MVEFDLLGQPVEFRPGQFFYVTLLDPPYTDARGPRRHFSIVNSPNEKGTLALTTRLRDSGFKRSLRDLPIGAAVEVGPIAGRFTLPEDRSRPLVFIAGGIGITPFRSMLRYVQEERLDYRITLLYSNRDRGSAAFLDELEALAAQNPYLRLVLTMTDDPAWRGERRRIDAALLREYLGDPAANVYYLAGPPALVEAASQALAELGVDAAGIKKENFVGY
jgi:ferredoxin-NADP reductase